MLEKCSYPYLSIDHLKMGLIRSGNTPLTPKDDDELVGYLWPIVREMIKTAIENRQDLIVEGCYVPFNWRQDFTEEYLKDIRFICLAMSEDYIEDHFEDISNHGSDIERRLFDDNLSREDLEEDNARFLEGFRQAGEEVTIIDYDWKKTIAGLLN
jgi:hypothetical protein